jgi:carbohydrate kinase (thermoresistant glucokinase family)
MGVSAAGKSSVGERLAAVLGTPFLDGDSLHPPENVVKMTSGTPLTDDDRAPWLAEVGRTLADAGRAGTGLVIACSALRRAYRSEILFAAPRAFFVHLDGSREILAGRIARRTEHFMPTTLLESQLATLEPLGADEPGASVSIDAPIDQVVAHAVTAFSRSRRIGAVDPW